MPTFRKTYIEKKKSRKKNLEGLFLLKRTIYIPKLMPLMYS